MKMQKIKVNNGEEFIKTIQVYKSLYMMTSDQMQELAEHKNTPYVLKLFIGFLTSEDEKICYTAFNFLHGIISGDNIEFNEIEQKTVKNTGTFILTIEQNKIYENLFKNTENKESGDIHLLKLLAVNIDYYNQLTEIINNSGFKMTYKTGAQQIKPEITALRDCTDNIQKIIKDLGLNTLQKIKNGVNVKPKFTDILSEII
ncbi:MAG: P27 family phage terminase small subunit [Candidatus Pacearchaeota archaeon]